MRAPYILNYLAHANLAGPVDSDRVAGVVGDFVKGLLAPPPEGLSPALALDRMGEHRLRRPNALAGAGEELLRDYAGFEEDCLAFLPDAMAWVATVSARREAQIEPPLA